MELLLFNGHHVVRIDGNNYVVDTGSPVTFNYLGLDALEIDGERYPFRNDVEPPCSRAQLYWLTGRRMAGIIGLDVIRRTGLTIDLENGTLDFAVPEEEADGPCAVLPFSFSAGQTIVTDAVSLGCGAGERVLRNVIIDTGATVSYVSEGCAGCLEATGELLEDYSPMLGQHISGHYLKGEVLLPADGGKRSRRVKLGIMPEMLEKAIGMQLGCCDAVLGISALTDRRIVFDFNRMEILTSL